MTARARNPHDVWPVGSRAAAKRDWRPLGPGGADDLSRV